MAKRKQPTLGDQLRLARTTAKLTQVELAAECEFSQRFLSDLENNRRRPNVRHLNAIAEACSGGFLIDGTEVTYEPYYRSNHSSEG